MTDGEQTHGGTSDVAVIVAEDIKATTDINVLVLGVGGPSGTGSIGNTGSTGRPVPPATNCEFYFPCNEVSPGVLEVCHQTPPTHLAPHPAQPTAAAHAGGLPPE